MTDRPVTARVPAGRARALRGATLVAALLLLLTAVLSASPANADPGVDAATRADALASKVERLQTRAEIATERYNAVDARLAGVVTEMITASARLDTLTRVSDDSRAAATRRISAIYRSGGGLSLYATVLDGTTPDDLVTRIRTVQSLMDDDLATNTALTAQVDEAQRTKDRMARLAATRTQLERQAREGRDEVQRLLTQTQRALDQANAQVRALAEQERARREAAAEAAAQQTLAALSLPADAPPGNPYAAEAISAAAGAIGLPYVWGGTGPDGYDCSGLVQWAYGRAGLPLLRVASDQFRSGPQVALSAIAPGDLVFWATDPSRPATIHHVAMYVGDGKMIEAPHTGAFVRLVPLRLGPEFAGAVRPGVSAGAVPGL